MPGVSRCCSGISGALRNSISVATRRYDLPPKIIPQKIEVRRFRRLRRLKEISHKFGSPRSAVKILRGSIIAYHFDAIAAIAMQVQHPKYGLDHAWSVWDNADTTTISSCYSTASILQWRLRSVIEASFVASWESSATAGRGQRRDSRRYQCPLLPYSGFQRQGFSVFTPVCRKSDTLRETSVRL